MQSPKEPYHLRRAERALSDNDEITRIIRTARYLTLAMCHDNQPYQVALNHGYDEDAGCLFFHCATQGRKIDILRANPKVWAMVIEDLGYRDGACDHSYRSVMLAGRVSFLENEEEKRHALEVMIRQQEREPERVMEKLLTAGRVASTMIGRIDIESSTAKQGLHEPEEEQAEQGQGSM